ncbi:MAG: hypothetical protein SCH98_02180 [Deferrisomatales bacterium]|nr:hypothetical protein [Deferrisomatales bacterium]
MKKFVPCALVLGLALLFALAGCSGSSGPSLVEGPPIDGELPGNGENGDVVDPPVTDPPPPDEPVALPVPDPNDPAQQPLNAFIVEPVLSELSGQQVLIPNTLQIDGNGNQALIAERFVQDAVGAQSLTGHEITQVSSPNDDMEQALSALETAADNGVQEAMEAAAAELRDILLGTTQGRIYDGFAMLNYNRGDFVDDHVPGEYKMKRLRDSGDTAVSIDGQERTIWEVTVNQLWYDDGFDSDTFLIVVPVAAHPNDLLRIRYRIYAEEREEFAPITMMMDHARPGSAPLGFKAFDTTWETVVDGTVAEITVDHPPIAHVGGIYTWGWRAHPPKSQFLQPVFEIVNVHTGETELDPEGRSFAERHRELTIDDIGDAAPEKKMYVVAQAVLEGGAPPAEVLAMLSEEAVEPRGTWDEWVGLAANHLQLPPEAWDVLTAEDALAPDDFGPYDYVSVFLNQKMYGDGPVGAGDIETFGQGDWLRVKVINLDSNTHYYRVVDFGPRLTDFIAGGSDVGSSAGSSFEIFDFKPIYGAPKVAEMQWRAGWGFRPGFDVIQQPDVFSRDIDQVELAAFFDGAGDERFGYQYSEVHRGGDFRFNPPPFVIGSVAEPSAHPLREGDETPGLLIGSTTEGFGIARMCTLDDFPAGSPCGVDLSGFHPLGMKNIDTDGDGVPDVLFFPPFLRNPNPEGGDIIPPVPAFKPFLHLNPANGSLYIDPDDPAQGFWVDRTYAHGAPVFGGASRDVTIEAPRAAGQIFYQFDHLYHDNAIFSPHPK